MNLVRARIDSVRIPNTDTETRRGKTPTCHLLCTELYQARECFCSSLFECIPNLSPDDEFLKPQRNQANMTLQQDLDGLQEIKSQVQTPNPKPLTRSNHGSKP